MQGGLSAAIISLVRAWTARHAMPQLLRLVSGSEAVKLGLRRRETSPPDQHRVMALRARARMAPSLCLAALNDDALFRSPRLRTA